MLVLSSSEIHLEHTNFQTRTHYLVCLKPLSGGCLVFS